MKETRVARRYALALFKTAKNSGSLDIVATDIHQLKSFAHKERRFLTFLETPQVPTEQKVKVIRDTFTTRLAPQLVLFLELLLAKHRTGLLPEIGTEFERLMEDFKGLVRARVITATHVDEDYKMRLRGKLEQISGKQIEIVHKIDRSIIGGIIVFLHNQVIDKSIRHQVETLRHDLLAVKVH